MENTQNKLIDLGNGLFGISVPIELYNIKLYFLEPYFRIISLFEENEKYKSTWSTSFMFVDFGGRKKYPKELEILGTASLIEIDFDCEPYVENLGEDKNNKVWYKDYCTGWADAENKQQSFYSFLFSKSLSPTTETKILILKKL